MRRRCLPVSPTWPSAHAGRGADAVDDPRRGAGHGPPQRRGPPRCPPAGGRELPDPAGPHAAGDDAGQALRHPIGPHRARRLAQRRRARRHRNRRSPDALSRGEASPAGRRATARRLPRAPGQRGARAGGGTTPRRRRPGPETAAENRRARGHQPVPRRHRGGRRRREPHRAGHGQDRHRGFRDHRRERTHPDAGRSGLLAPRAQRRRRGQHHPGRLLWAQPPGAHRAGRSPDQRRRQPGLEPAGAAGPEAGHQSVP